MGIAPKVEHFKLMVRAVFFFGGGDRSDSCQSDAPASVALDECATVPRQRDVACLQDGVFSVAFMSEAALVAGKSPKDTVGLGARRLESGF